MDDVDVVVIGGGFYGCTLALFLRGYFERVVILEKGPDILQRASTVNQARIHVGYHYPRSFLTAYRSFVNFPRFIQDFQKAVRDDFTGIYAIARNGSLVNSRRFYEMFHSLRTRIQPAPSAIKKLFDPNFIEDAFTVEEKIFDARELGLILRERLDAAGVRVVTGHQAQKLEISKAGKVRIITGAGIFEAGTVFNCAYSQANQLLTKSGFSPLPLKHELTEMALIQAPEELKGLGLTVMDGPFFSVMPYPPRELHSLTHVRYTPHFSWNDQEHLRDGQKFLEGPKPESHYLHMIRDASRFLPLLNNSQYAGSLYEIKTVLTENEVDDGRPILFKAAEGTKNLYTVMGGKIDNIYDIFELIEEGRLFQAREADVWRFLFPHGKTPAAPPQAANA